ncbi:acyltransferase family protein [Bradyrhizobium sp.]|jgi:peptidoglycan/LPS O-acetylase OafA/YrhL|uniref:acyltransferase family protein n=1 Tax=Bradyrhizobium sp. TaxID=376 RepID=UPI003C14393A
MTLKFPAENLRPAIAAAAPDVAVADRRDRLLLLQVGRGLAAVGVAISHARLGTSAFVEPIPGWLMAILAKGFLGVDFFFVLSGFIILNSHLDDESTLRALKSYVLKRVARIYVPYLPVCAVVILSYLLFPSLSNVDRDWGWWTSIFLVPSQNPPALVAAWTLIHEMLFYTIFVLFFLGKRVFLFASAAWTVAIIANPPTAGFLAPLFSTLFDSINIEFMFGMICALLYRKITHLVEHSGWAALAVGAAVACAYFLVAQGEGADRLLFGLGASFILLGAVLLERRISDRIPRFLVRLGDASYAVYLLHNPMISLTSRAAAKIAVVDRWCGSLIFSMICVIGSGWLYHTLFERPVLSALRKIIKARS